MNKIIFVLLKSIIVYLFFSTFAHSQFGKGEIKIDSSFKEGYQNYLQAMKEEKGWNGAFAADNNGSWGWHLAKGPDALSRARKAAIESCNEYSTTKNCRLFARNSKIFWKWDNMPDLSFDASQFVNASEVNVMIGGGDVFINYYVKEDFELYKNSCKDAAKNQSDYNVVCYFAISKNGTKSGWSIQTQSKSGSGLGISKVKNQVKAGATADCMEDNNKKQCYLYAEGDEIIWKN